MSRSRNIVLQLTAPGTSALASVRVAGDRVGEVLARRFSRALQPGRATHGELRDDAGTIDDPLVVLDEDSRGAELHLHGGVTVIDAVIALFVAEGFEHVAFDPEDQAIAAMLAPGATSIERDVIASLPLARTARATRALLGQLDAWRFGGATADPTDRSLYHLLHPPTVAIVGIPNAGKSTLANHLFARQRSIVSDVAGTTRDWVGEEADLDGLIVKLIDTPGRRATDDAIEAEAIVRSEPLVRQADLVIVLLDATASLVSQRQLVDAHPGALVVLNKTDVARGDACMGAGDAIPIVANSGVGIDVLVRRVHEHFGTHDERARRRYWLARHWHHDPVDAGV